jgi:hypothetical protein
LWLGGGCTGVKRDGRTRTDSFLNIVGCVREGRPRCYADLYCDVFGEVVWFFWDGVGP